MFNIEKEIVLCQNILEKCKEYDAQSMAYTKLIKLVYFCERESLRRTGAYITGDVMYSMPLGPVPTRLLNLIHGYAETKDYSDIELFDRAQMVWNKHFSVQGKHISIDHPHNFGIELDREEQEILSLVIGGFGHLEWRQLVNFTHEFLPEWQNPHGSSTRITDESIQAAHS